MRKILLVGAEAMPFAATGGLGDVMGSLPAALKKEYGDDVDVRVVMPLYKAIRDEWRAQMKQECVTFIDLAWRHEYCGIKSLEKDGVTYYFIDNERYFKRDGLYGHFDDGERYAFFCAAVLEMFNRLNYYPDVLHANDWQSALTVIYLKRRYGLMDGYRDVKTVFTIHNIEYQGVYDFSILGDVFDIHESHKDIVEWEGCINLMKGAIQCADVISTVSPTYAEEIKSPEFSHGLDKILNDNWYKLRGILNGIDYVYYNPAKDSALKTKFSKRTVEKKAQCKVNFQKEMALPENPDIPMYAMITRLASHKGLDIVCDMIYGLLEQDIQFVVLGTGEAKYEDFLREIEYRFPNKVRSIIKYDRDLSKRIYAAADVFLMPSKSEPCGLSQMIASRYGAIPVTRETGGLYDSIKHYYIDEKGKIQGNGFTFANYGASELYECAMKAYNICKDKDNYIKLVQKIMATDFSWSKSAKQYMQMYSELI